MRKKKGKSALDTKRGLLKIIMSIKNMHGHHKLMKQQAAPNLFEVHMTLHANMKMMRYSFSWLKDFVSCGCDD